MEIPYGRFSFFFCTKFVNFVIKLKLVGIRRELKCQRCQWIQLLRVHQRGIDQRTFTICLKRFVVNLIWNISRKVFLWSLILGVCRFINFGGQRRRNRINEKIKALQKLIPNSNKVTMWVFSRNCFHWAWFLDSVLWCSFLHRQIRLPCWMKPLNIWSSFNYKYRWVSCFNQQLFLFRTVYLIARLVEFLLVLLKVKDDPSYQPRACGWRSCLMYCWFPWIGSHNLIDWEARTIITILPPRPCMGFKHKSYYSSIIVCHRLDQVVISFF